MYKKKTSGLVKHYDFVLLDMVCLQLAFISGYFIVRGFHTNPYEYSMYRNIAMLIELVCVVVMLCNNTFKNVLKRSWGQEIAVTLKHVLLVLGVSILFLYLVKEAEKYSRLIIGSTFLLYFVFSFLIRIIWKQILRKRFKQKGNRSLLVVADSEQVEAAITDIRQNNYDGFRIVGLVLLDDDRTGQMMEGIPVVASRELAATYICKEWIDEVLVVPKGIGDYPEALVDELMETGVTVHVNIAEMANYPGKKQVVEKIGHYTVLTTSMNQVTSFQLLNKRMLDICGGLVGCMLTGIIFLFVAPAIYIQSPGPVFFSQERVGKNGKKFKMYKFRSMYMDAEERKSELMEQNKISDGRMFKLDFDPRVIGNRTLADGSKKTGIGQFIRDTSLDEFPQFWNVLTGSMSLVGTRPPLPGEVGEYELRHRTRLAIKPGITGMWQVSGRSEITDFEEIVALDREYINNWSLGRDIQILFKTVLVVVRRDGAV